VWRTLSEADTAVWGGSCMRRLYGCAIAMIPKQSVPTESCHLVALDGPGTFSQVLLTWSQVCSSHPFLHWQYPASLFKLPSARIIYHPSPCSVMLLTIVVA
jgi:hypothetical protein